MAAGRKGWRTEKVWGNRERICRCGMYGEVLHHIDRNPDNEVIENIEPLCRACHCKEHFNDRQQVEDQRRKSIIKSWEARSGRTVEETEMAKYDALMYLEQGLSTREIASLTGLSKSYVHYLSQKHKGV